VVFGYSTNAFVNFSLTDAIQRIAQLGFKGVEIMGDRPHLYPPDFNAAQLAAVKRRIDDARLTVTNINSFTLFAVGDTYLPSWIDPEAAQRELRIQHTRSCLAAAEVLGSASISIPPGGPLTGLSRNKALGMFYEGLERVIPMAEELGVMLLIEPEPDLLIENTPEFIEFMRNVASPSVGLNFDIGHFYCAGEDPVRAFEVLFEWIGHVHLEDIAPSREHRHLIPGKGAIAFEEVFAAIKRLDYRGDISLELYPYVDMPEAAGRESLAYLRPVVERVGLDIDGLASPAGNN
jgi:sugar phosphate isomerase/epimerase